jgi:hypothetical protein
MRTYFIFFLSLCGSLLGSDTPSLPAPSSEGLRTVMTIDPKMRALDYSQAFELLRREKTSNKVLFQLVDGSSLTNVIDLTVIGQGTLLLFKCGTPQGIKHQVIGVEKILSIQPL